MAEYLSSCDQPVEGVIFGSSLISGGHNVVLFSDAAVVEGAEGDPRREVDRAYLYGGDEDDPPTECVVFRRMPPPPERPYRPPVWTEESWFFGSPDAPALPEPTLRLTTDVRRVVVREIHYEIDPIPVEFEDERDPAELSF